MIQPPNYVVLFPASMFAQGKKGWQAQRFVCIDDYRCMLYISI